MQAPANLCRHAPCSKPLIGRRKNAVFCAGAACKTAFYMEIARADRRAKAAAEGRKFRNGPASPTRTCLLPECGKALTGKQERFCSFNHGIAYRDRNRPTRISAEERERRIAGATCALETCGKPVPRARALKALRNNKDGITRFFCHTEHREKYWTKHAERKKRTTTTVMRSDPYAVLRALVPAPPASAEPLSSEVKAALAKAEEAVRALVTLTKPRFSEEKVDPSKLAEARAAYASESVGLRGGAAMVGVTAPTFSEMLRRLGDDVRPAPRWQEPGAAPPAPTPKAKVHKKIESKPAPKMSTGRSAPKATPWRPPSAPRVVPPAPPPEDEDDRAARRGIANVLAGNVKLPIKAGPIGTEADQAEWDRCRSWRRMLIGLQWGKLDPIPAVKALLDAARKFCEYSGPPQRLLDAERVTRGAARTSSTEHLYRVCAQAVDAYRALLPSRSSIEAENALCDSFRAKHSKAPNEFGTVGH